MEGAGLGVEGAGLGVEGADLVMLGADLVGADLLLSAYFLKASVASAGSSPGMCLSPRPEW